MTTKQPAPPSDDLKSCPFCGGEAIRMTLGPDDGPDNEGGDVITCSRCGASSHVEFGRKENLISQWNTRTPDPALRIAREALEKARQFIENGVDFGYIQMPDHSVPDAAHETLPAIRQALAQLDQQERGE